MGERKGKEFISYFQSIKLHPRGREPQLHISGFHNGAPESQLSSQYPKLLGVTHVCKKKQLSLDGVPTKRKNKPI